MTNNDKPEFLTSSNAEEFSKMVSSYASSYDGHHGVQKTTANVGRTFVGWNSNQSVKSEYGRSDYEHFRKGEAIPEKIEDIIKVCGEAYDKVGIVRNVIDLMGDFACQGIRLRHPNKSIERFYQAWFNKVDGKERSERFLNMLYRYANVIVKKSFGKINVKIEKELKQARAVDNDLDGKAEFGSVDVKKKQIPLRYSFLNPSSVEVISGELATFTGERFYALKLPYSLRSEYNRLRNSVQGQKGLKSKILEKIPDDVRNAIISGTNQIALDPDKMSVYHYKKDDWDLWAKPMVFAILNDLIMLEKMKLADISALDGAISNIRLWTLGIFDGVNSILPSPGMMQTLRNILANNVGGGTLDLVWGPELKFEESQTKVYEFLGEEKYVVTLDSIYDGLGIPTSLRSGGKSGSNSNNFVALKTLVERLQYGRDMIVDFWNEEIKLVQKAMGFRYPATVVFDQMVLADEAAMKQIMVNLADRSLISDETLLDSLGIPGDLEAIRVKREEQQRETGKRPPKASTFHNPQTDHDLKKTFAQGGSVTPTEVGLELEERKEGEEDRLDKMEKMAKVKEAAKPSGEAGRPKNVTETTKRKPKSDTKPRQNTKGDFASHILWANMAQKAISELITPGMMKAYGKTDTRALSHDQVKELEQIKFGVLMNIEYGKISEESVLQALSVNNAITQDMQAVNDGLVAAYIKANDKNPSLEEARLIQSSVYAIFMEHNNGDN